MPDAPLTVSQISARIKAALADGIPGRVHVVGEVSNLSNRSAGGHWFFSLKDAGAALRCVMFASKARQVRFDVRDGLEVIATGRVDFYDAQGNVQLYVDKLEPVGQGALELELKRLMAELRKLGYFDPATKMELPVMPRRIAVVTSRSAAALQDVINTAHRRWLGCRLLLYDVRVQGDDAAPQIAKAIRTMSRQGDRLGLEAIILTRGGGSIEDLWAFNERVVADAIFKCRLPIVAAIGHETDTTIAELVADVRCATPTQAAMTLVPDHAALEHQVAQLSRRLTLLTRRRFEHAQQRLLTAARHTMFRRPQNILLPVRQRLDALDARLRPALPRQLEAATKQLDALTRQLEAIGPGSVLSRGYSYTLGPRDKLLRSVHDVQSGDRLTTVLADGRVLSRVEDGVSRRRKKQAKTGRKQESLFG